MRVAIVDDDHVIAQGLRLTLEGRGHEVVVEAHSADQALPALTGAAAGAIDVAFIDLRLDGDQRNAPGLRLADVALQRGLKVVIMTGLPSLPDGLPADGLLMKPFSGEQVHLLLQSLAARA